MRYLACELPQATIARNLHLSVKTVSNHKQAAMRKLGFKRNADLYHWLRMGGLKTVERPRGRRGSGARPTPEPLRRQYSRVIALKNNSVNAMMMTFAWLCAPAYRRSDGCR